MHLLFFTPSYPPFPGGGEQYVRGLAQALCRHGHQVTVFASAATTEESYWASPSRQQRRPRQESDGPVTVVRCPLAGFPGGRAGLMAWRRLMGLIATLPGNWAGLLAGMARAFPPLAAGAEALAMLPNSASLVHAFNLSWEHTALLGWRWAQAHRLPFLLTPYAHLDGSGSSRAARLLTMDHQRQLLAGSDMVLTLTPAAVAGFRATGVACRQVAVLGAGIDLPAAGPGRLPALARTLPPTFALFLGRTTRDKGALDAAAAVLSLEPSTGCALVLAGSRTPEFDRFFRRLPAAQRERLHPLGPVSEEEKQHLLQRASLLLLPSRSDALGLVLLEAWAHGLPVIGARAGGIPQVIDEGENGLLVPFGDVPALAQAIQTLLADPALRRRLGQQGQEKVARDYQWGAVCRRALAAYRAVLPAATAP